MTRTRLISAIIVTMAYWSFVAFLVLGQFACIQGDPEYGCPSAAERARTITLIITGAAAIYALGFRVLRKRHRSSANGS